MYNIVHRISNVGQLTRTAAEFHCITHGMALEHLLDLAESAMNQGVGFSYIPGPIPTLLVDGGHEYRMHKLSHPQARR